MNNVNALIGLLAAFGVDSGEVKNNRPPVDQPRSYRKTGPGRRHKQNKSGPDPLSSLEDPDGKPTLFALKKFPGWTGNGRT